MRDPLGDDLGRGDLPKVGGWVFLVVLPLVVAVVLAVVVPLGSGGRRVLSIVSQIASARSELLPILIGSQLGVSALVVAMTQFQPERWRGTPKELGDCWLSEVRLVASKENRYIASMFGLLGISSVIVFGVAACVSQRMDVGGVLLLLIVWGIHAVSSAVLIMVPATGAAAVADYWRSLIRLVYVAEMWPGELEFAKKEVDRVGMSPLVHVRQWKGVVVLGVLFVALIPVIILGRICFGFPGWLLQIGVVEMMVASALLSIGAGWGRWSSEGFLVILFWLSWPLMLLQGFILELEFIAIVTEPSLVRNVSIGFVVVATLFLGALFAVVAWGARTVWARFNLLKSTLTLNWIMDLRSQRRCGNRCSSDEREAVERSVVEVLGDKNREDTSEIVKNSVLLGFLYV
ncbi:hypothetical protein [Actinomyces sp. HMSC08A09]|jgi:membrane protein|uniref:hypothetical protein n=1 Tax=Actinomyces sp. HMSC08A09 TaxID=1581133 RepID=UPI00114C8D32|nr:hypothetical protein [Actinomyces sp. HMSC08A09]